MHASQRRVLPWFLAGATGAVFLYTAYQRYRRLAQTPALSTASRRSGISGQYIQAGPWSMYTRSAGDELAPVVVLLHGLVISSRYMEPLALALADNGYRVLAPDLPGYGESVRGAPLNALEMTELADALYLWLASAGFAKATFIGNSFGCQVLTMFAVRYPQAVHRLVLQGPTIDPDARSLLRQVWRDLRNGRRERQRSSAGIGRVDYAKAGPWRALSSIRRLLHDRIEVRLPKIHVPCLILQGSRDPVVPLGWAQKACALLPDGRLQVIEGATHTMNYVYPHSFAQAIDGFLREDRAAPVQAA